jgi:hypothetical protein
MMAGTGFEIRLWLNPASTIYHAVTLSLNDLSNLNLSCLLVNVTWEVVEIT